MSGISGKLALADRGALWLLLNTEGAGWRRDEQAKLAFTDKPSLSSSVLRRRLMVFRLSDEG